MRKTLKTRILRTVCICTAFFALSSFSGCSDILVNWDDFFSFDFSQSEDFSEDESLEESVEQSEEDSEEESVEESVDEGQSSTEESEESTDEQSSIEESTDEQSSIEESTEEKSSVEISGKEDSEEISEDSVAEENAGLDFSIAPLSEQYGYQQLGKETNGTAIQKFYKALYDEYVAFHTSTKNVQPKQVTLKVKDPNTGVESTVTRTVYQTGEVDFAKFGLSVEEATTVWSIAMLDFPEMYWQAHNSSTTSTKINLYIDGEYANYSVRQALKTSLETMAEECYLYIGENATDTERALAIQDYILGNMSYAYESDGVTAEDACWAHNVEGLTKQSGVCESYAKTYDYFCDLMGLECITVAGLGGEGNEMGGHAWNIVKIDGVWYNVDLTWEDAYANLERVWFGVPNTEFSQTHIPYTRANGYGSTWLYDLPTLSEERLQPVAVIQDGGEAVYYPNLDKAFASIQDETANYQILLCPETNAGKGEGISVYPYAHTFTTKNIPVAGKITLTGKYISRAKQTVVTAKNAITVTAPVTIEYGTFEYPYFGSNVTKLAADSSKYGKVQTKQVW